MAEFSSRHTHNGPEKLSGAQCGICRHGVGEFEASEVESRLRIPREVSGIRDQEGCALHPAEVLAGVTAVGGMGWDGMGESVSEGSRVSKLEMRWRRPAN